MKIIDTFIPLSELEEMAKRIFGNMVKAVVDIDKELIAIDAELHADLETALLEQGSQQQFVWGINFYPELVGKEGFIEFDSMINVRPSQNNRSRGIENSEIRAKICAIVAKKVRT